VNTRDTASDPKLELSVIVPTYNRSRILARCLAALGEQTLAAGRFEVLVSDDGSQDDTKAVVLAASSRAAGSVRYLAQPNSGANRARNRAIREARGRHLLFINDDTIALPHMLARHLEVQRGYADDRVAVLGRVTIAPELSHSLLARLHLDASYAAFEGRRELDWRAFYTCNVSIARSFLLENGLFDEDLRYHEDLELSERLSHRGLRVIYSPSALGYHDHLLEAGEYLDVARREARALAHWYRKAPQVAPALASLGFPPALPPRRRWKYSVADTVIRPSTFSAWQRAARACERPFEGLSLAIYRKLYQAVKRHTLREELRAG
jgi:glycosyltransferase involved in cell wall biosynthesis